MSDVATRFHETWIGMVQPIDGLVVSVPVMVEAQCMQRQPPETQHRLLEFCPLNSRDAEERHIADLETFLAEMLDLTPDLFDDDEKLPEDLSLYVPEGRQTIRPTMGLRRLDPGEPEAEDADSTPASRAGSRYVMLIWDLPDGLDLDKAETTTGSWEYPPNAKFDRLLRHCRVPIGLLTNRRVVRLVYAPHGESSGSITFRLDDMATVGGRPILDAMVMLLSAVRFFGVAPEQQLPAILAQQEGPVPECLTQLPVVHRHEDSLLVPVILTAIDAHEISQYPGVPGLLEVQSPRELRHGPFTASRLSVKPVSHPGLLPSPR